MVDYRYRALIHRIEAGIPSGRRIFRKFGIIDQSDERVNLHLFYILGEKHLPDVVAHEFRGWHLELVAKISPESLEQFCIEKLGVILANGGGSTFQTPAGDLVGAATVECHHVGM